MSHRLPSADTVAATWTVPYRVDTADPSTLLPVQVALGELDEPEGEDVDGLDEPEEPDDVDAVGAVGAEVVCTCAEGWSSAASNAPAAPVMTRAGAAFRTSDG
jgi:hypothetical protein